MAFKYCPKCDKTKSYIFFGKNKSRSDGLQSYCKECMKISRKKNSKKEKSKELAKIRQKRYREKKKEKKLDKKELMKVNVKTQDSITNGRRNLNDRKSSRGSEIILNPKPIKRNGD